MNTHDDAELIIRNLKLSKEDKLREALVKLRDMEIDKITIEEITKIFNEIEVNR